MIPALAALLAAPALAQRQPTLLQGGQTYDINETTSSGEVSVGTAQGAANGAAYDFSPTGGGTGHTGTRVGTSNVYEHKFGNETHIVTFYDDGTWEKRRGNDLIASGTYEAI